MNALRAIGYEAVWQGERSWNGVAILARNHIPVLTCASLPGNPEDHQARYIEAAVQGVLITSIYLPNGNPQPGPKFKYKLAWFERLIARAEELIASGAPVVLAGDYNVVPTPQDIYPTRSLDNNALIQPESRQAFARLLAQGWTDAGGAAQSSPAPTSSPMLHAISAELGVVQFENQEKVKGRLQAAPCRTVRIIRLPATPTPHW